MNHLDVPKKTSSSVTTSYQRERWLVVATDGTLSEEYHQRYEDDNGIERVNLSYVYRFYLNTTFSSRDPGSKLYLRGPRTAGQDVMSIKEEAIAWLKPLLAQNYKNKIVLIGHSRGAMISVLIANWLKTKQVDVTYMGLYDAVDRTPNLDEAKKRGAMATVAVGAATGGSGAMLAGGAGLITGLGSKSGMDADTIPGNVKSVRHGIRDSKSGSRWWFGNTATSWAGGGSTFMQSFHATHGAMGGSVPEACEGTLFGYFANDTCWYGRGISKAENVREGNRAHSWILDGARTAGVPVA